MKASGGIPVAHQRPRMAALLPFCRAAGARIPALAPFPSIRAAPCPACGRKSRLAARGSQAQRAAAAGPAVHGAFPARLDRSGRQPAPGASLQATAAVCRRTCRCGPARARKTACGAPRRSWQARGTDAPPPAGTDYCRPGHCCRRMPRAPRTAVAAPGPRLGGGSMWRGARPRTAHRRGGPRAPPFRRLSGRTAGCAPIEAGRSDCL